MELEGCKGLEHGSRFVAEWSMSLGDCSGLLLNLGGRVHGATL